MKKKIIIISLLIILSISFLTYYSFAFNKNNNKDSDIAYYIDGVESDLPDSSSGVYKVNVTCSGGDASWNYDNWTLQVDSIDGELKCDINFLTVSDTDKFNNVISSLVGTSTDNYSIVSEEGIRYQGKNPSNYVWFNNELWQIIGVISDEFHGVTDKNLVKIVRKETIGSSYIGSFDLLNNEYYLGQDATESTNCITTNAMFKARECRFDINGITSSYYRNMIESANWMLPEYVSTNSITDATSLDKYDSEGTFNTSYIGLINASDYGLATSESTCSRSTIISYNDFQTDGCSGNDWLNKYKNIKLNVSSTSVGIEGGELVLSATLSYSLLPTAYLKDNVYVVGGNGTINDPYIIRI